MYIDKVPNRNSKPTYLLREAKREGKKIIKKTRERDIITALIVERLLHPASKLATSRILQDSALFEDLNLKDVSTTEIYTALDWLHDRQELLENKVAKKHLT